MVCLKNVSFEIEEGGICRIMGRSGWENYIIKGSGNVRQTR